VAVFLVEVEAQAAFRIAGRLEVEGRGAGFRLDITHHALIRDFAEAIPVAGERENSDIMRSKAYIVLSPSRRGCRHNLLIGKASFANILSIIAEQSVSAGCRRQCR